MQLEIYTGLMQSVLRVKDVIKNALCYSQTTASTDECTLSNDERLSNESILSNAVKPSVVSFHEFVRVVLVPTRDEYIKYNLANSLWYNGNDYKVFTSEAMREIDSYVNINTSDLKAALSGLCQSQSEHNHLKTSKVKGSCSNSNSNSNNCSMDDDYGNFVEISSLPVRVSSTQSSFSQEDEPQFVLDL